MAVRADRNRVVETATGPAPPVLEAVAALVARDTSWSGGQKTVTIVTTVTEPYNRQFSTKGDGRIMSKN